MHASALRTGLCLLIADSAAFLLALLTSWSLRYLFAESLFLSTYLNLLCILAQTNGVDSETLFAHEALAAELK